ncbi:MAG: DUF1206 domain-containing protein [Caulobacter sp.]|nr:DUF1206 domain-containing protein [Caulobacter sp.]
MAGQARRWLRRLTPWRREPSELARILEWTARAGYAARGFVYLSIGTLAALAAVELARSPAGSRGAVTALADWPLGRLWIAVIAGGLIGFAVWRALQSVFDADHQGRDPKAIARRVGQAISGLVYGGLAWSLLEFLDGLEDISEAAETDAARQQAAGLLDLPLGRWLVIALGLFILGAGIANLLKALGKNFGEQLACHRGFHRWACWIGRIGYGARGIAFAPLGYLFIKAGWLANAGEARKLGGALQMLEAQPMGSPILLVTGIGLVAFGLFAMIEARWRHIDPPDPA